MITNYNTYIKENYTDSSFDVYSKIISFLQEYKFIKDDNDILNSNKILDYKYSKIYTSYIVMKYQFYGSINNHEIIYINFNFENYITCLDFVYYNNIIFKKFYKNNEHNNIIDDLKILLDKYYNLIYDQKYFTKIKLLPIINYSKYVEFLEKLFLIDSKYINEFINDVYNDPKLKFLKSNFDKDFSHYLNANNFDLI